MLFFKSKRAKGTSSRRIALYAGGYGPGVPRCTVNSDRHTLCGFIDRDDHARSGRLRQREAQQEYWSDEQDEAA
jgi:hypothetical protein